MKILVACEFSGIVRDAFIRRGHDAISCDLLRSESIGPHYQGNVFDIIDNGFDMMIAFPPCTYLAYSGTQSWNEPGRIDKRLESLNFFAKLYQANINKICIENPRGCASPVIAKYTQEIQPYYFGESEQKLTWLWLKGLPKLKFSKHNDLFNKEISDKPIKIFTDKIRNQKLRSIFWPKIASAMAEQWG